MVELECVERFGTNEFICGAVGCCSNVIRGASCACCSCCCCGCSGESCMCALCDVGVHCDVDHMAKMHGECEDK